MSTQAARRRPPKPARRWLRVLVVLAALFALLVPTVYWVEAEKEAHILCGMVRLDASRAEILRTFGSAELLRVETIERGNTLVLRATTPAPIGHERCEARMADGVVTGKSHTRRLPTVTVALLALLISIPVTWWPHRRSRRRTQVALGVGTVLLLPAAFERAGSVRLPALADVSPVLLAAALLVAVAIAALDAATAQSPSQWRRSVAPTIIALACGVLLLASPTA